MIHPEIKADWVAALRSGEFKQGRGHLKSSKRFCCLGVLAEVTECLTDNGAITCTPQGHRESFFYVCLPSWMVKQLDLTGVEVATLASMNDTGKTFSEIADYIEENL